MPRAFVTGISGQDGSYLSEQLLAQGWDLHALVREASRSDEQPVGDQVVQHVGDLTDFVGVTRILDEVEPDVVFNLGGISSVATSWDEPAATGEISGVAVVALLDASLRLQERRGSEVRFVQASSSEIFGDAEVAPQSELTPLRPISPYGLAKAYAHQAVGIYRAKGLFATSCILYNHESPRRPRSFVTRKITAGAAEIVAGKSDRLMLGNLDVKRDWGWAPDYVDALTRAAAAPEPADYVIATGVAHSVREFVAAAFNAVGIPDWESYVGTDARFVRPADAHEMRGDSSKALSVLGWSPTVDFTEVVALMTRHDLGLLAP
ncbi:MULTISPECIES: GDP-mannose 4,6-dehydratase [unclassified Cryobacterium]|uniref:GDP-mannose 4,6-dehydratase n=1 Tax=unclassified Cryobacterium TaxID=2649013 RepID=UPI00106DB66F|nr:MULTISPECIES: GDP-mannose 4,6-dehydratase [unclassified Cryobacterium]TFD21989.1 GDP-mannose 4,6-dehydratase [Cryobacterium sp. TMT4-10]TFD22391.1 GDP-mannose 4,6-dehydratase [Cryobacterium sp. TMT2-23]